MKIRQGDVAYIKISKLPNGLEASDTDIILKNGSGGNSHTFTGGIFYPEQKGNWLIGYLKANKDCVLYHIEHGKKVGNKKLREINLKSGIYEVRHQTEERNGEFKPVID